MKIEMANFDDIRRGPGRKSGGRSASQRNFRTLTIARTHDIGRRYPNRAAAIIAGLASAFGRSAFAWIASHPYQANRYVELWLGTRGRGAGRVNLSLEKIVFSEKTLQLREIGRITSKF